MKNENETKEVFKPEHIGQQVHCSVRGNGLIVLFEQGTDYPIHVKFDGLCKFVGYKHNGKFTDTFTTDGRFSRKETVSLSFGHKDKFDYGTPTFVYKQLEFTGMPIWCWVGDNAKCVERKELLRQIVASDSAGTLFVAITDGLNNIESAYASKWFFAMALTDEELIANNKHNSIATNK